MASYTPLLFHRKPPQLYHREPGGDIEDDMMSLYSVADVTLPRITSRDMRRRDVHLRKVEKSSDSIPVSCNNWYFSTLRPQSVINGKTCSAHGRTRNTSKHF
jgi:hypothetical protein